MTVLRTANIVFAGFVVVLIAYLYWRDGRKIRSDRRSLIWLASVMITGTSGYGSLEQLLGWRSTWRIPLLTVSLWLFILGFARHGWLERRNHADTS